MKKEASPKKKPAARKAPLKAAPALRLEWIEASELKANGRNWRTHPTNQMLALADAIAEVGWAGALLYNERTKRLIDGHARKELFEGKGKVPVLVGSWDEATEAKILASLDPIGAMASADKEKLDALLRDVNTGSEALQEMLSDLAKDAGLYADGATSIGDLNQAECPEYKPPFQWFGGKSRVAPLIWAAFGDLPNFVEPFFGSGAVLFRRPHFQGDRTETVNDKDGFVSNLWRSIKAAPDEVAKWADWPVNENDLSARHAWLVQRREDITSRLEGDPDWFDAKIAGWWVWGQCAWIGSGWCSGKGPWEVVDGKLVKGEKGGQKRKLPNLGNDGRGVNRKLPNLGDDGRGVNRQRSHLGDDGRGLCELYSQSIQEYLSGLCDRLRRVRVCCGDWARVVTHAVTDIRGITGVFFDPPYAFAAKRDPGCYSVDEADISTGVREWAIAHGDDPNFRIALCGYEGEHEMPDSWRSVAWKTGGGMSNTSAEEDTQGEENQHRERIWLSKHCFDVSGHAEVID